MAAEAWLSLSLPFVIKPFARLNNNNNNKNKNQTLQSQHAATRDTKVVWLGRAKTKDSFNRSYHETN